jgi:hypothetical protein
VRKISQQGLSALSEAEKNAFNLKTSLPQNLRAELIDELRHSHCGLLPEKAFPAMVNVQRATDGSMADAMIRSSRNFGAILIAGNGHIRKDRGVPLILRQRLPGSQIVSLGNIANNSESQTREIKVRIPNSHNLTLGLIEVSRDQPAFADYELANKTGDWLYDFVIFTPKFDTTDHCLAMRQQILNMKKTTP